MPEQTSRITWTTTLDAARKHGYLCAAFGTVGDAMPFSIFRAGNEERGYTYELFNSLNAPGEEFTGPFTTAQEVRDEAERVLAEFLDSAGLTWKDSE